MGIWAELRNGNEENMDNRDKEIEYLEDTIKALEKTVEELSKPRRKCSIRRLEHSTPQRSNLPQALVHPFHIARQML